MGVYSAGRYNYGILVCIYRRFESRRYGRISVCTLSDFGSILLVFFQDALNGGTNALMEYTDLVKKVVFKNQYTSHSQSPFCIVCACVFCGICPCHMFLEWVYTHGITLRVFYYTGCTFVFTWPCVCNQCLVVFQ